MYRYVMYVMYVMYVLSAIWDPFLASKTSIERIWLWSWVNAWANEWISSHHTILWLDRKGIEWNGCCFVATSKQFVAKLPHRATVMIRTHSNCQFSDFISEYQTDHQAKRSSIRNFVMIL
jgi:hypothetical protein